MNTDQATRPLSLVHLLAERTSAQPGTSLYTFLEEGGDELTWTYEELERRARRIAAALQEGAVAGERVMLLYPPGLEYIAGFFGCLHAGAIAVPAYPPDPARLERTLPRLRAIIEDARATVVLTTSFIQSMGEFLFEQAPDLKALRWIATDALAEGMEDGWRRPQLGPDTLAFLQYTSGSTGTPKGVMLSHGNLLHNLGLIAHAFGVHSGSRGVIWLPPYHDMGLIGGILEPLYKGFPTVLMSPLSFLRRPLRWLEAITRFKGTVGGGPNFAYDLCVRKVTPEERASLDLSSWEMAFSGAEPIRPETLDRFEEAFAPCGFRRESFYPCYGLAEGTLIVSGGAATEAPILRTVDAKALEQHRVERVPAGQEGVRTLVSCGRNLPDQEIAIVHTETRSRCPEGVVGEVWVKGPSVAQGYWGNPEATQQVFGARLAEGGGGPYLRTGDLGFMQGGELFVTGRLKDLIIIRGRNHYPQDIELTVERSHPALRAGCGVAFSIEEGSEERLVVVQELDRRHPPDLAPVAEAIRQAVAEAHEVQVHAVVLVPAGVVPKTSSGKVQRRACRAAFLAGTLEIVDQSVAASTAALEQSGDEELPSHQTYLSWAPEERQTKLTSALRSLLARRLGLDAAQVDPDKPLSRFGLDSLQATELGALLSDALGVDLSPVELLRGPSTAELAQQVASLWSAGAPPTSERPEAATRASPQDARVPLSYAQQRLWFLDQLNPGSAFYTIPLAVRLKGPLDVPALERSLQEIVRRHEALRTTFPAVDGRPWQVVSPTQPLPLQVLDLTSTPAAEREEKARALATEEVRRPFNLASGPLLRATLLRLGGEEHVLVLAVHHIAFDGWSARLLATELTALYQAFREGRPSPLPELSLQYADYARRQQELLRDEAALQAQIAYWKQQLADFPPALELPVDRPRPAVQSFRGALYPFELSPELSSALREMARAEGATLFMVLLAAFKVLLMRITGQPHYLVGCPVAGRGDRDTQGMIGLFINTVVMRADLSGRPTFRELLARERETALAAYAHQEVPFEKLVESLQPGRDLGRSPLFQVMFTLQEAPDQALRALRLAGATAALVDIDPGTAKFELSLSLVAGRDRLAGALEYSTDLFDTSTVARLAGHLRTLLEGVVADAGQRIEALPLLTEAEQRQLLVEWNATNRELEGERQLHRLIEAQAERTPEAVALVVEGESLSYRELDGRANQLARHLRKLGVRQDELVGLCVERSVEMVVGLLGVLKAGGAYVPIDPTYPADRIEYMLSDSAVRVLLSQERLRAALPPSVARVVCLDSGWGEIATESRERPSLEGAGSGRAYVIYTSGSTGKPKGVQVTHEAVVNFLRSMKERPGLSAADVLVAVTTLSFDIAGLELYLPLAVGARVVVASREVAMDGPRLASLLEESGATVLQATPTMWRLLLDTGWRSAGLKALVGGEALPPDLAAALLERCGAVWNLYGPTETTIWSTAHALSRTDAVVSIGRPILNTQVRLLGRHLELVPVGVPGELYIGGLGLARGYLGRPELTAERFIPDPYGEPGARLYRTGDLARYRPDGTIEYLGRADFQVKVRGYRIEPGEVEAVLRGQPGVRDAVVVARGDAPGGGSWLVGYVVPGEGQRLEVDGLRKQLKEKLPEYMVPSAFVVLEALPLTPNGKVDRKALPAPDGRASGRTFVAPRTPTEELLAGTWGELLGLEQVGAEDSFFDLGGHSLLATQAMSRVRSAFGVEMPLRELFDTPTVAGLAVKIDGAVKVGSGKQQPPLVKLPRTGAEPLSFAQQRLWFLDQLEAKGATYNTPAALRLEGALDTAALARSFNELVRRHEVLRTSFQAGQDGPVQVIAPSLELSLRRVDLTEMPQAEREQEAQRLAEQEARRPFNLEEGPLVRVTLIRLAEADHVLVLVMHHIVSDGWSVGVLVREFSALYDAFLAGKESPLPALPIQYADYARWQREYLQGDALEAQLGYWRQRLAGAPHALDLPTDHPRPPVQTFRGATHRVHLPAELARKLRKLSHREGATLYMTLLAGFQALLHRYSGQGDICIGSPIAGRGRTEVEGLIGVFINTLVMRSQLSAEMPFRSLLAQVKETTLGAYAHQEVPFEKLVEALQPERDQSRSPLFQVMLILQNAPATELALPGLKLRPLEVDSQTSKFDLTLTLEDTGRGLEGGLEYSTDLFDASTIARMVMHLQVLLEGIVANPEQRLGQLELLTGQERQQLLVEWNATGRELEGERQLHRLIEAQAERTPEAVALVVEGESLSYRELDGRANQLARHLRKLGVRQDELVGLCVERSVEMVVGLLGVLKAGGAYVPIDPTYPADRIEYMLSDSAVRVLLSQERLRAALPPSVARVVCLDSGWGEIATESRERPSLEGAGSGRAYVIYTSGSTGKPKGVQVTHEAVVNFLRSMKERPGLSAADVLVAVTTLSFDIAGLELYLPLAVGARVVVASREVAMDGPRLASLLEESGATVLQATPTMWRLLLDTGWRSAGLKALVGGEALPPDLAAALLERCGAVWNLYGPTETTIWSTAHALSRTDAVVSIGRPILNTQVRLLGRHLELVPVGVPGELYIGGMGLARGYLGRPELTAERFIPDPYGEPGARLYRTGDLARYRPDGTIEYLGRADFQVKVRGYRIEPGEVEAVLRGQPGVRDAVVVARGDAPGGGSWLVGYVVPGEGQRLEVDGLRKQLKEKLPEYMVPSAFVVLEALPLTPNGKVDRKALPAPDGAHRGGAKDFVAPQSPTEQLLAELWAQLLGVKRIGLYDDFFELGGHSLLATQVVSRIRATFKVELPLREMFGTSTLSALARRVEAAERAGSLPPAPPVLPVLRTGAEPLSFAQQRLWFLDQMEPQSAAYNIPAALRLEGALDEGALEQSFNELVRRHEALRTTFEEREGGGVQVIAPSLTLKLARVDLTALPEADREKEAARLAAEEARRPFDLKTGPLLRVTLLRLGAAEHMLVVVMHHIVSDGWSLGVFVREMMALYGAFKVGQGSPLEALPVQYADYARWQREWLRGEVLEQQLTYWRRQLEGAPYALELPTDHPRPPVQSTRGATHRLHLSAELASGLRRLSQREGTTLYMTLLAGFQALLHRYTGQGDLNVGTAVAGRGQREVEGLIGFFVNTLVMRARLSPGMSFRELLAQVRETTLGAYAHQEVPFEKLVETLQPERDQSRSPLFQAMFILQNALVPELALPGLALRPLELDSQTSKFDLALSLAEKENGLEGGIEYCADLFDASTIARLAEHLRVLLEGAVAAPERRVDELPLLTEAERRQLLVDWNDTRVEYPRDACVHTLFEAQVKRTPDAVAVEFAGQSLTYAELNRRANQLAHHLRRMGVGPGVSVALCVERSLEMVIGTLGILKAGGAYVPLDPAYPFERLAFMLEDTAAPVLLTQERLVDALPSHWGRVIRLDSDWGQITGERAEDLPPSATADDLAYVIYTSGSTGRPKGVCVPHRGVVRLVMGCRFAELSSREVFLQLAPIAFDASTLELWGSLLHGARLVVFDGQAASLDEVGQALERHGVTLLWLTAALFEQMQASQPRALGKVRQLLSGGDVLPVGRVRERLAAGAMLINGYGPTEMTTFTCCNPLTDVAQVGASVSIGRPIQNTQVYLLDGRMQPVPVGVVGELYAGGDGLARGYLSRPELTAEKFVPNPFSAEPGARLYRTGDLARYLPDGRIDFLGRRDTQVKLRGFRIELAEIETMLGQYPAVQASVVIAREDVPGNKRLVAYAVAREGQTLDPRELRGFLKEKLPEYMVPSAFVALEALPLSPNGKVDRKALPAPEQVESGAARDYVAPRTPTEQLLAALWGELLGVERLGVEDSFFEMGGHSLLATQAISRVRSAFRVELPLRALFDTPTVAGMAAKIDAAARAAKDELPLKSTPRIGPEPLSFAQQRLWFLYQLTPESPLYNIPAGLGLTGVLDVPALERSFNELVRRHESLRTTFRDGERGPVQEVAPEGKLPLEVVDLRGLPEAKRGEAVQRRMDEEARRSFDLGVGPLLRATLLKLEEREHVLVLVMHHIVSDGWSIGVLIREVATLYGAFVAGKEPALEPLAIQYPDFARWQREWMQGEVLEKQLAYWRKNLAGIAHSLELPTDRPRPPVQTFRGAKLPVCYPRELLEGLKREGQREGVTLFMMLLAGLQVLLHRYSGQDDLCVGTGIAGRNRPELEGLIGFFVNTLVLRAQFRPGGTFRELLAQVRETTLGAYAHQDVPFEKLVEELQPQRDLSRAPLFQVMLILQNTPEAEQALPELTLRPLGVVDSQTAKFDLAPAFWEGAQGLEGFFEYNTDLFDASTVARMAGNLRTLLEAVVADPGQRVDRLPLLTEAERRQLLVEWNDTKGPYAETACLHHLVEAQVERTPEGVALEYEDQKLTYREMDRRANQLARRLRKLGVGPEVRVGLCLEKSIEAILGILGILKAGGAYVPMDPMLPAARLGFILEDSRAQVLLTQKALDGRLPEHRAPTLYLDADWAEIGRESAERFEGGAGPRNLAYVIYTSGSTGKPKGTLIEHRSVCNLMAYDVPYFGLHPGLKFLQFANLSFDTSVEDIFSSLCSGATLRLAGPDDGAGPALHALLKRASVNVVNLTPAVLAATPSDDLPDMKVVISGGEACTAELVARWTAGGRKYLNGYGPTENTVGITWAECFPDGRVPPIGRPLLNVQAYVLDRQLQPVPVGVVGELYAAGLGLARGYLDRPELTADKFLPDPFSPEPGRRMYGTGDLAKYRADGTLDYAGRADHQVKVRGFRIELGEIEATLQQHPAVKEVVVVARDDGRGGSKRLVGYVVPAQGSVVDAGELRRHVKEKLPDYMVPSAFVMLEALPLTPNGKLDRKALPTPESVGSEDNREYVAPRTPTEEFVAGMWAQLLGMERVSAEDNFFELGGHSLLAMQIVARVREAFQVKVALRELFTSPTVAGLAAIIARERQGSAGNALPPLERIPRDGRLPLSFSQWRLWFIDRLAPKRATYGMFTALRLTGDLDVSALEWSFREVIRRHESLRTTFIQREGQPEQVISPPGAFTLPVVDLTGHPQEEREARARELAVAEGRRPFELTQGPLLRLTLLRLDPAEHMLLLQMHHIIGDEWSAGVLAREASLLYSAFRAGQPSPLPELEIQYADFAHWQRQWLTDAALAPQIEHWKKYLGPNPPVLDLPTDRPRPAAQTFRGALHFFSLEPELVALLQSLTRSEGSTMFITLLSAFAAVLQQLAGQPDVIVGVPVANRIHPALEKLIGLFVNIVPVRLSFGGSPSYREMLARARRAAVDAFDHQNVPFEKLVDALQIKRDQSRPALRQVAFSFQNAANSALQFPGLNVEPAKVDPGVARLDLTLLMADEGERITGRVEYNTDLFEADTIARFIEYLRAVLADMAAHLERPCLALPSPLVQLQERSRQRARQSQEEGALPGGTTEDSAQLLQRANLTENQMLFWFAQKLQPDVELYFENVSATFTLSGEVDPEHFQRAWQAVVDRSDSLRSVIDEVDGVPRRKVRERLLSQVEQIDLSRSPSPQGELQAWLKGRARQRLQAHEQLFDCALLKLGPQDHVWHLRIHHIVADARSLSLIFTHVADFYRRSREGSLDAAPLLPLYQEYVAFEQERRGSDEHRRLEAYWRAKLAETPPVPSFYRVDPASRELRTERLSHDLGSHLSEAVKRRAQERGFFSPAVVFLTALFAYLHRVTGERTLRVGTPLMSRPERFANTLGLFMTAAPLQVSLEDGETFDSLALKVQKEFVQTVRHQGHPIRNRREGRVYDVYFNYQNMSFSDFCGLPVRFELGHSGYSNDSLTLQVQDFGRTDRYTLDLDFRCDAFDGSQRSRTQAHYLNLLEALLRDGSQPIVRAPMLSGEELQLLVREWNQTQRARPSGLCLQQLIEAQVDRTPDAIAVRYEDSQYTYRELDRRANQLARHLQKLGVGPDVPVAVCMHRSLELVVSLVGILKAGGAYVPLDPDYPKDRLAYMLASSGAPVLLTKEAAGGPPTSTQKRVYLDKDWEHVARESDARPSSTVTSRNLAYVIYTSGSTGKPKGSALEHEGICNRLLWMQEMYGLGAEDRVLQKTPYSFDVSVWEFFWPLMTGACLVVARPGGHQDSHYLVEAINRFGITTLHFVPSMLQVFLENENAPTCRGLKRVICSGEALPSELQRRFFTRLDAELHNLYGPTEASVDVTYYACVKDDCPPRIPIGRPISNTQMYVLDREMKPVPQGIAGELYIGGVGLARGYLNRPDLTAEKFVCDPFSLTPGARLYRTGDLARHRADGNIEFLGRIDHQVKLRGLRIELGEIEAALAAHPEVREAVVTIREDHPGDKRLVGYIVAAAGKSPSSSELRGFLKESLPEYMVPAAIVSLDAMPLSPAGKVDRKALPAPRWEDQARSAGFVAPASAVEKLSAALWAAALQVDEIGLTDDFFELGGNSLMATQLVEQFQRAFLVELPLNTFFEQATLSHLIKVMEERFESRSERSKQIAYELLQEVEQLPEDSLDPLLSGSL